jgi:iron complex transport system ATP-binding protein
VSQPSWRTGDGPAASVDELEVRREGRSILAIEHLEIQAQERWALLGPNGSGKSTLLSVLAGRLWPTRGRVTLLGERVGAVDLRVLRARLGLMSASLAKQLRPGLLVREAVVTGVDGALETWWSEYDATAWERADQLLEQLGVRAIADAPVGVISEGERARVLLARVLIAEPELLCLDEPSSGLDLGAREDLLARLGDLFDAGRPQPVVLVTHHLEELPVGLSHALLLREGRPVAQGPIDEVLTSELVSAAFDIDVDVTRHEDGRRSARARRDPTRGSTSSGD